MTLETGPLYPVRSCMDRRSLFIAAILTLNALGPLRYYLLSQDPYDERFAWRMFSPVRMLRCEADFRLDGQQVELGSSFHAAWITLVQRGRMDVTEAVADRLCLTNPGRALTLRYRCQEVGGEVRTLAAPDHDLCQAPP